MAIENAENLPVPSKSSAPRGFNALWAWVCAAAIVVVLGMWVGRDGPKPDADDWGQYLLHAESLAEGRDYSDIRYVFSHYAWGTGPPIHAPGLPLTMAPVLATVGFHNWMHLGVNLLAVLIFMAIVARYFGRYNPVRATTAALLLGVGLVLVRGVDTLQPDLPFAALLWGTLLLADSSEKWSWPRTLSIVLVGLWAILYRVAALPIIPAMVVFGVLSWKAHKGRPFVIVGVWILATAYLLLVVQSGRIPPPEAYIEFSPTGTEEHLSRLQVVLRNAVAYRLSFFEVELYPFAAGTLNDVYHLVLTPLVIVGLLVWLEGSWFRFGAIFGAAYLSFLLLAPFATERYMWPLWPLIGYGLIVGLDLVLDRLPLGRTPKNGARSGAFIVVVVVVAAVTAVSKDREPTIFDLETVQEVVAFAQTIPASEEPTMVFFLPRSFAWMSGLPTMALFPTPSDEAVLREVAEKRISHVILGTLGHASQIQGLERWTSTINNYPERFAEVFTNDDFTIYRVETPGGAGSRIN